MASREEQEYSSQAPAGYIGDFLQKDIFPRAQTFLQDQFNNYGADNSSPFTYTGERVAGFDPRETRAMGLADQAIGSYMPYLNRQSGLLGDASGIMRSGADLGGQSINTGLAAGRGLAGEGAGLTRGANFTQSGRGDFLSAVPNYNEAQGLTRAGAPTFTSARGTLGRAENSGAGSTGMFNPNTQVSSFFNPYEDQVVQQTLKDVREGLAQGDMGLRDEAVSAGAFGGSRSRMRRDELAENTARGAAEAIAGIRSGGYEGSRNAAQQAFEAQQGRQSGFAGLQAGLAGQEAGFAGQEAQSALARAAQLGSIEAQNAQAKLARGEALNQSEQLAVSNALGRGAQLGQLGQTQFGMGLQGGQGIAGLGSQLGQGLGALGSQYGQIGSTLPGLQQQDISSQMAMGGLGRGRNQSLLDLGYQNFVGQYNLPMQTLQNAGALTASLGPLAGGYGYAGGAAPSFGSAYAPAIGRLPNYNSGIASNIYGPNAEGQTSNQVQAGADIAGQFPDMSGFIDFGNYDFGNAGYSIG